MRTMRSAPAATSSLWVTMMIVWPSLCSRRNSSSTSRPPSLSRAPVGSSASSSVGSLASARAMARRWRWPPDSTAGIGVGLVADPEQIEQVAGPALGGLALRAGEHGGQDHVLQRRHALEQVEELEHDADVAAAHAGQPVLVPAGDLLAGDHDRALVGEVEAGDEVEQRRLAAARRAHDGDELAGRTSRSTPRRARTGASSASNVRRTPRTVSTAAASAGPGVRRPSVRDCSLSHDRAPCSGRHVRRLRSRRRIRLVDRHQPVGHDRALVAP